MSVLGAIGKTGRVVAEIRPGEEGEVMLDLPVGGSQAFPARAFDSKQEIEVGAQVWVEEQNGRTIYVTTR